MADTLVFDRTEVHVQLAPGQEEARAVFTATNPGRRAVRIRQIQSSCGCTGAVLDRRELGPGESTKIEAVFTKGTRQGLSRNRLQVYLEGATAPAAVLTFAVDIPRLLTARPAVLFWTAATGEGSRLVEIEMDGDLIREIGELRFNENLIKAELKEDPQRAGQFVILVRPTRFDLAFRETLTIRGQGPDGLQDEVRIQLFVQP